MLQKIKNTIPTSIKKSIKKILGIKEPKPYEKVKYTEYAGKKILDIQGGNNKIGALLLENKPFMVGRLGSVEQSCVYNYMQLQNNEVKDWKEGVLRTMPNNAGFFPNTPQMLEKFAVEMIEKHLQNLDILGVWFNEGEKHIAEKTCPQADFMLLRGLEPYFSENPWSKLLEGKKVLVIHPFQKSIENQYKNRKLLFENPDILPKFELSTIKAVQSRGHNPTDFDTWFDALKYMQDEMTKKNFDILIVGCGAYGFPLASYAKNMGKQAIHIGGATQILFGIKGSRWEKRPFFAKLFNEHWVRPLSEESAGSQAKGWTGKDYW